MKHEQMNSVLFFVLALLPLLYYAISIVHHSPLFPTQNSDHQKKLEALLIPGAIGPESIAFDLLGDGPYVGISDGRIIKWSHHKRQWTNFSTTSRHREGCEGAHDHHQTEHICGRPLGMCFNEKTGELYIADAYLGLHKVGPEGGVSTPIATHAQGVPIGFTNGLDINHSDGAIYFTDSSSLHQRRNYISLILSGDRTGRLMKYEPQSQQVIVLLENLSFPNGVALSEDGSYLILAETTYCRILRYWLKTSKAGTVEIFAELPGFPDNIKRSPRGGYWVAVHARRRMITGWIISNPWIGNALLKLPIDIMKAYAVFSKFTGGGLAVRLSEDGDVLETLEDKIGNRIRSLSEVLEKDGVLWIGSIAMPSVGMYKM